MNIIITMGGKGKRMSSKYPAIPKWMININNRPLIDWVLDDAIFSLAKNIVVVCLSAHQAFYDILGNIKTRWPQASVTITYIESVTSGQLRTAAHAFPYINNNEITIVRNIDTINFLSNSNLSEIKNLEDKEIYLPCFYSESNDYSYYEPKMRVLQDGYIKGAIAVSGLYVFGSFQLLKNAFETLERPSVQILTEVNMTLAIIQCQLQGATIQYGIMNQCIPVGTPAEYDQIINGENYLV